MDPALAAGAPALIAPTAPVAPIAPVMVPSLTRDSFNAQSLGRGLNAHVKQVGTRRSNALLPPPANRPKYSVLRPTQALHCYCRLCASHGFIAWPILYILLSSS